MSVEYQEGGLLKKVYNEILAISKGVKEIHSLLKHRDTAPASVVEVVEAEDVPQNRALTDPERTAIQYRVRNRGEDPAALAATFGVSEWYVNTLVRRPRYMYPIRLLKQKYPQFLSVGRVTHVVYGEFLSMSESAEYIGISPVEFRNLLKSKFKMYENGDGETHLLVRGWRVSTLTKIKDSLTEGA